MTLPASPKEIVATNSAEMNRYDFAHAAHWLSEDFRLYWPQSGKISRAGLTSPR